MTSLNILEQFLQSKLPIQPCASERDYYALWHERGFDALPPFDSAIAGALVADRLPWVFTAGYQATLRSAFTNLPGGGWAAFAATEDVQEPERHPGTALVEDGQRYLLNGNKSWVAHSEVVDHLIVTVNDPDGDKRRARGVIVERMRDGVTLTHREQPKFLGAMSQGFARFENTPVALGEVFEFEPIRQFGRTEAKFVMLASAAFMIAHTHEGTNLQDRLFATAVALLTLLGERETSRQVYASIDREFQLCVDEFEQALDTSTIPDYAADKRLFRMYTERVQRRRAYAKRELQAAV